MWTIIEECLNPPVVCERARAGEPDGGLVTRCRRSASPRSSTSPRGSARSSASTSSTRRSSSCRGWVDAERVTFKYGLGEEMIGILKTLHTLGLDRTDPVPVKGVSVAPA